LRQSSHQGRPHAERSNRMRNLMAGLGILVLVAAAGGQAPESGTELPPGIAWQPDYDKALDLARELNRPIMVAFILMGESANEEVIKQRFRDPRIIEQSRKFVCLLACRDPIEAVEGVRADGTRGPVSREFGSASPVEIQRVEQRARYELTGAPMVSCPQF